MYLPPIIKPILLFMRLACSQPVTAYKRNLDESPLNSLIYRIPTINF